MKKTQKLFLYSLSSLTVMASSLASAQEMATAPTLEGGLTAMIGTWYATPAANNQEFAILNTYPDNVSINGQIQEVNPGYDFGFEAALGYVFENTANSIELSYRGLHTTDDAYIEDFVNGITSLPVKEEGPFDTASSSLDYKLDAADLMISQFLDVGTHVQMRFSAGASYARLEKTQSSVYDLEGEKFANSTDYSNSKFSGFGPRVAADARYDFGQGFGILGGASLAYYIGNQDATGTFTCDTSGGSSSCGDGEFTQENSTFTDNIDSHGVTNLRANAGIDYVYFFDNDERSTIGLELGYQIDYYADAINEIVYDFDDIQETFASGLTSSSLSFSGPYLNLKGAF